MENCQTLLALSEKYYLFNSFFFFFVLFQFTDEKTDQINIIMNKEEKTNKNVPFQSSSVQI
jgi:hypothetical protein